MRKLYLASCTIKNETYPEGFTDCRLVVVTKVDVSEGRKFFPEWFKPSVDPSYLSGFTDEDLLNCAYIKANQGFSRDYPQTKLHALIVKPAFSRTVSDMPLTILE